MKNYIFGLDISTSIIGLCILDKDLLLEGKNSQEFIIKIDSIDLKKFDNMFQKASFVNAVLSEIKEKFSHDCKSWDIAVEKPLVKFASRKSSADTLSTLIRFNGVVSYIALTVFGSTPKQLSFTSARKQCGVKIKKNIGISEKMQTFNFINQGDLNHISWPRKKRSDNIVDWAYDATDAYVIAKASINSTICT